MVAHIIRSALDQPLQKLRYGHFRLTSLHGGLILVRALVDGGDQPRLVTDNDESLGLPARRRGYSGQHPLSGLGLGMAQIALSRE